MAVNDLPLIERAELIVEEMTMPPQARQVITELVAEVQLLRTWIINEES